MQPRHLQGLPEGDTDASKHVEVLTMYKILLKYIYIYCELVVWMINCYVQLLSSTSVPLT